MQLTDEVAAFLREQDYFIISTLDKDGSIHSSCKGVVNIDPRGEIYILDLYKLNTFKNLNNNPAVSLTAVDGHRFKGYSLKGKAKIVERDKIESHIIAAWEDKIISRVTKRLIKNIQNEKGQTHHPEVLLPKPQYMIVMQVNEVMDLSPQIK